MAAKAGTAGSKPSVAAPTEVCLRNERRVSFVTTFSFPYDVIKPEFPFCLSDFNFAYRPNGLPRQGFGLVWPVLVHGAASRAGMGRFSVLRRRIDQKCIWSNRFRRHFSPHLVIKICCLLRAAYPAGSGSVTILCKHAAKQPPRQVALRQQQPIVAGVFNQTAPGFHQPCCTLVQ